jgi:hypothetical protein
MMMLNRDNDYDFTSNFVYDTVEKSIEGASTNSRRQWRPRFRIVVDTFQRLFNFFCELKS